MKPPSRLLNDPEIAPELRSELQRAARAEDPFDVAAGLANLQAAIDGERAKATTGDEAASAPAIAGQRARRIGAGMIAGPILAAALAAAAAVGFQYSASAPARSPHQMPEPARAAKPAPRPATAAIRKPASAAEPPAAPAAPKRSAALDAELQREVAQLGRIRQLLARDPLQALQLAHAGHREFGRGMLHEEREGLAVIALWHLGRSGEARQRTRAFVARYPRSALREQIERLEGEHRSRSEEP